MTGVQTCALPILEFKVELDGSVKIKQGNSWVAVNETDEFDGQIDALKENVL